MKNIHVIGFVLWFTASFLSFKLFTLFYYWFDTCGIFIKIIILFLTAIITMLGFYKILLSLFLLVNKNHEKFNLISTTFSMIGLIGIVISYLYFGFNFTIDRSQMLNQSLTFIFGFLLVFILFNGFVLFPKSITKITN